MSASKRIVILTLLGSGGMMAPRLPLEKSSLIDTTLEVLVFFRFVSVSRADYPNRTLVLLRVYDQQYVCGWTECKSLEPVLAMFRVEIGKSILILERDCRIRKSTPCFARLLRAFSGSHMAFMRRIVCTYSVHV